MDGFRVDTSALAQISIEYKTIGGQLEDCFDQLRRMHKLTGTQTVGNDVLELLCAAIQTLESSSWEARELGEKCKEIAEVYNRVEKQVASVVSALPGVSPFSDAAPISGNSSTVKFLRVDSAYRPTKPVLLNGNQLPCESWLLDRAIKAILEGED